MLLRDRRQLVPHDGSRRCASLGGPKPCLPWPLRLLLGGGFRPTASTARPFDRWSRWRCVVQVGRCANFCLFKGDKCKVTLSLQPTRAARAQHARKDTHAARAQHVRKHTHAARTHSCAQRPLRAHARAHAASLGALPTRPCAAHSLTSLYLGAYPHSANNLFGASPRLAGLLVLADREQVRAPL